MKATMNTEVAVNKVGSSRRRAGGDWAAVRWPGGGEHAWGSSRLWGRALGEQGRARRSEG